MSKYSLYFVLSPDMPENVLFQHTLCLYSGNSLLPTMLINPPQLSPFKTHFLKQKQQQVLNLCYPSFWKSCFRILLTSRPPPIEQLYPERFPLPHRLTICALTFFSCQLRPHLYWAHFPPLQGLSWVTQAPVYFFFFYKHQKHLALGFSQLTMLW